MSSEEIKKEFPGLKDYIVRLETNLASLQLKDKTIENQVFDESYVPVRK